jgi:hypothetical protein
MGVENSHGGHAAMGPDAVWAQCLLTHNMCSTMHGEDCTVPTLTSQHHFGQDVIHEDTMSL